jgi:hypothetical protein
MSCCFIYAKVVISTFIDNSILALDFLCSLYVCLKLLKCADLLLYLSG